MRVFGETIARAVVDIICDMCGKSCRFEHAFEYLSIAASWGYDSHHDGEIWAADLCEQCAETLRAWIESNGGKIQVQRY